MGLVVLLAFFNEMGNGANFALVPQSVSLCLDYPASPRVPTKARLHDAAVMRTTTVSCLASWGL
jgi:hypothetical protein